jgi:metal-dependent amidase/aminoacylase/carboxypeptidase family protein
MAKYRIMYWKHIPQSFTVEGDGRTIKIQLSQKIQDKIDAYAMAVGATSTTDYAKEYKRGQWVELEGTPEEVAEATTKDTKYTKVKNNKSSQPLRLPGTVRLKPYQGRCSGLKT